MNSMAASVLLPSGVGGRQTNGVCLGMRRPTTAVTNGVTMSRGVLLTVIR